MTSLTSPGSRESGTLLKWAAGLSVAAALVHGAVTEEHLAEWWGYGLFFIVSAIVQGVYGFGIVHVLITRDDPETREHAWVPAQRRAYYAMGIAGNAAIIALYGVTRTYGIPFFGPEAGVAERVTALSLVSKAIELALVVVLVLLSRQAREPAPAHAAGVGAS